MTEEEAGQLRKLARANRLTLNTLALGAWALLLSHYGGEEDVVFGVVVSGRPAELAGAETMVGMLINTLAFRARVDAEDVLTEWLARLQARQAEQRQYEYSPLPQVQRWSEVRGGRPLFESLLNFMNYPVDEAVREWGGPVSVEELRYEERVSYPLNLVVSERGRLELKVKYDRRRFGPASITRLLALLRTLLAEFAARPEARLGKLKETLEGADREQQSARRNDFKEARRRMLQSAKQKGQRVN
jgi:non-ribosomal peptide synthetase component F